MSHQCPDHYAVSAMQYLNTLCDQLDRNEPIRMPAYKWFVQAAVPMALGFCVVACNNSGTANNPNDKRTGAVEICNNKKDDDKNGFIDCNDPACRDHAICVGGEVYAGPPPLPPPAPDKDGKARPPFGSDGGFPSRDVPAYAGPSELAPR